MKASQAMLGNKDKDQIKKEKHGESDRTSHHKIEVFKCSILTYDLSGGFLGPLIMKARLLYSKVVKLKMGLDTDIGKKD